MTKAQPKTQRESTNRRWTKEQIDTANKLRRAGVRDVVIARLWGVSRQRVGAICGKRPTTMWT